MYIDAATKSLLSLRSHIEKFVFVHHTCCGTDLSMQCVIVLYIFVLNNNSANEFSSFIDLRKLSSICLLYVKQISF